MTIKDIDEIISDSVIVHTHMLLDQKLLENILKVSMVVAKAFRSGKKVLLCGNGGSASDAQHIAAELSGKFMMNREPLFAEALHVNTSYLTATANDYSYDVVYSRLVEAQGNKGDVMVGLSTSGNSPNVVNALKEAKRKGMITVGFTGQKKSKLDVLSNYLLKIPSENTARIQEGHILVGHVICEMVERELFG